MITAAITIHTPHYIDSFYKYKKMLKSNKHLSIDSMASIYTEGYM